MRVQNACQLDSRRDVGAVRRFPVASYDASVDASFCSGSLLRGSGARRAWLARRSRRARRGRRRRRPPPSPTPRGRHAPGPTPGDPSRRPPRRRARPSRRCRTPTATPPPAPQAWVQALRPLPLWSGPDDNAEQLGTAARWDYFLIADPQMGGRLYVFVSATQDYAWVDALVGRAVGPAAAGLAAGRRAAAAGRSRASAGWRRPPTRRCGPTPTARCCWASRPRTRPSSSSSRRTGTRLHVQDPYSGAEAWLDARIVGPIDPPRAGRTCPARWWGISYVDGANLRRDAVARAADAGTSCRSGLPMVVSGWVAGEEVVNDNPTWAVLSDATYLYSSVLRPVALPAAPPPPASTASFTGRWIDLNLMHQVVVAYEGQTPVRLARTSTGRPGWETAPGTYAIQRRVEKETMESTSLIGLDAQRADYKVENVRWTQYFSADGKALHENYWKPRDEFGIPQQPRLRRPGRRRRAVLLGLGRHRRARHRALEEACAWGSTLTPTSATLFVVIGPCRLVHRADVLGMAMLPSNTVVSSGDSNI